ncbi:hypothetical protein [Shinella sp.]|uniref:hypothetical protein n=1 Tax=Shinella sp. TaxID=1870904 RepID=UPI0029A33FBE|nr:hypothetical protein [Shinella sp.]MDX3976706.1 hypothetical protein [Shinella sp.]
MYFENKHIAKAIGLRENSIRQWFSRSPGFEIGTVGSTGRTYSRREAVALLIAAEILRHRLAPPHVALPAAVAAATDGGREDLFAWIDARGALRLSPNRPTDAVAVGIPTASLLARLAA